MIDYLSVEKYADDLLRSLPETLLYHNASHAHEVCDNAASLGKTENISEEDMLLLKTAALFHDIGFLVKYHDNEKDAVEMIRPKLPVFGYTDGQIEQISRMILATAIPQNPRSLPEKILCDADLDNLGRDDFFKNTQAIWKELCSFGVATGEKEWYLNTLSLIQSHCYFTETARQLRNRGKEKNIAQLKAWIKERFGGSA
ncbi:MAG: HD domain-containing protein [Candidatus Aureabacteria bacterium]|nr:HD domain-containing protein [Candidatus Auribacterota bacterium]